MAFFERARLLRRPRFALILLIVSVLLVNSATLTAQDTDAISAAALQQSVDNLFDEDTVLPPFLQRVAAEYSGLSAQNAAAQDASGAVRLGVVNNGSLIVEVFTDGDPDTVLAALQAIGLRNGGVYLNWVSGTLDAAQLPLLDAIPGIISVDTNIALRSAGLTTSQADGVLNADDVRNTFGLDGTGVTIGVMSDSFNCYAAVNDTPDASDDVASGDLPAGIEVVQEFDDCFSGVDEGRAMMQLIHDLAPGADLKFHTAFGGEPVFASGIEDLVNAGADIIVDDVINTSEAMFQDDLVARAAEDAVAQGVPFFSSAGNFADASFETTFNDSGSNYEINAPFSFDTFDCNNGTYRLHDFQQGFGTDLFMRIDYDAFVRLAIQWDVPHLDANGNPFPNPTGLQAFLFSSDPGIRSTYAPVACGFFLNDEENSLSMFIPEFSELSSSGTRYLAFGYRAGTTPPTFIKYINFDTPFTSTEYTEQKGTIFGHSNAANVAAVGAANFYTPTFPAEYTSVGGTPILFRQDGTRLPQPFVREQPRFTAIDDTNTTFFPRDGAGNPLDIPEDDDTFPNFPGTSAAAPHAAAVAALIKQCDPSLGPAQIYSIMQNTATDLTFFRPGINSTGYDSVTGSGLIDAQAALNSAADFNTVIRGNGLEIADGTTTTSTATGTDLGAVQPGSATAESLFTINNETTNCGFLELTGERRVVFNGPNPGDFKISTFQDPGNGQIVTLGIQFEPQGLGFGHRSTSITIENNDPDKPAYTFTVSGFVPGPDADVNNDTRITPADAIAVLNRIGGNELDPYDIDGDGQITQTDVELVIVGIGTTFPVE
ncbi:MAG: S8 family serine peptidase [Chloroflexota bacterium]